MGSSPRSLLDREGNRLYLTPFERRRFLIVAGEYAEPWRTLAEFLTFSGCRISEALSVRASHIDLESNLVAVETLKQRTSGIWRQVPLDSGFVLAMNKRFRLRPLQHLGAGASLLWPVGRTSAYNHIKSIMADAEIVGPQATPKGLRHTFGTHAMLQGVPITLVKKWMGHARLQTTEIYLDVIGPEERDLARKMWVSTPYQQ